MVVAIPVSQLFIFKDCVIKTTLLQSGRLLAVVRLDCRLFTSRRKGGGVWIGPHFCLKHSLAPSTFVLGANGGVQGPDKDSLSFCTLARVIYFTYSVSVSRLPLATANLVSMMDNRYVVCDHRSSIQISTSETRVRPISCSHKPSALQACTS